MKRYVCISFLCASSITLVVSSCEIDTRPLASNHLVGQKTTQPIILVDGFFVPNFWRTSKTIDYCEQLGLGYAGTLAEREAGGFYMHPYPDVERRDVFLLEVDDYAQSLSQWSDDLAEAVKYVKQVTRASGVTLMSYGTGGLAVRKYLLDHPENHGVEQVVMVAAPHGGVWKAIWSLLVQEETVSGITVVDLALEQLFRFLARLLNIDIDAPILKEIFLVERNAWLQDLNVGRLPERVVYNNITLRVVREDASIFRRNGFPIDRSLPDLDRQQLSHVSSLQDPTTLDYSTHDVVLSEPDNYYPLYRALRRVLTEPFRWCEECLPVSQMRPNRVDVYYETPLAGLFDVRAFETNTGRVLETSEPAVFRYGRESYGRIRIYLNDPVSWPIEVIARSPDLQEWSISVVRDSDRPVIATGLRMDDPPVIIHIQRIDNLPPRNTQGRKWDLLDFKGSQPDLQIHVLADNQVIRTSEVYPEIEASVDVDEEFVLDVDPSSQSIEIRIMDHDALGHEVMAEITWEPGSLPVGTKELTLRNGTKIVATIEWERPRVRFIHPDTLKL